MDQDEQFAQQAIKMIRKQKQDRIDCFEGDYFGYLNNDFPAFVYFSNLFFPSINSAFQAARTDSQSIREQISLVDTPQELWEIAIDIEDPENWESKRLKIMEQLLRDKFKRNKELRDRLKETGKRALINTYQEKSDSNQFWGVVDEVGQNHLGKILERIRDDIAKNTDTQKWLAYSFQLEENPQLLPQINMTVVKDQKKIEEVKMYKKPYYFMGQLKTNDVLLAHPSISRSHAVMVCDNDQNVYVVDLGSTGGTFINGERVEELVGFEIKVGDTITFASSTRTYVVDIDYTSAKQTLMKQERELKRELFILEKIDNPDISQDDLRKVLGFSMEDTLYVGNIPFQSTTREVRDHFNQFGKVKSVQIPVDFQNKSKGFCLVTYMTDQQARGAVIKSSGTMLGDRKLRVQMMDKMKMADVMEDIENLEKQNSKIKKHLQSRSRSRSHNSSRDRRKHSRRHHHHHKDSRKDRKENKDRKDKKEKKDKKRSD